MRKLLFTLWIGILAALSLVPTLAQDNIMHLRVAHFSADAPAVDVYVNGEVAIEALEFPNVTEWLEIEEGNYDIAVAPAGTSLDDAVIGPATFNLVAGTWVTVSAVGSVEAGTLAPNVLIEDYSEIPEDGFARLSAFHAIAGAPAVDIVANGITLINNLAYPGTQGANDGFFIRDIPVGSSDLNVVLTSDPTTAVVGQSNVELEEDINYLVAAVGTPDEPQLVIVASPIGDAMMGDMGDDMDEMDEDMSDEDMDDMDESEDEMMDDMGAGMSLWEQMVATTDLIGTDSMDMDNMDEDMSDEDTGDMSEGDEMMTNTIADIVIESSEAAAPDFTILLAAIQAADPSILEALSNPDADLTVFAPTDEAFTALLASLEMDAETLLADTDLLNSVLQYHVLEGTVMADTVLTLDGQDVPTLLGEDATISISVTDDGVVLNDTINVIVTDFEADNGVIHVINGVLLPGEG